jgi:hypothetical protein
LTRFSTTPVSTLDHAIRHPEMSVLKVIEVALGLGFLFFMLKGLLGKFNDGELTKAIVALVAWLALVGFNSGLMKAKPLNSGSNGLVTKVAIHAGGKEAEA